jgi:hypothetical protein
MRFIPPFLEASSPGLGLESVFRHQLLRRGRYENIIGAICGQTLIDPLHPITLLDRAGGSRGLFDGQYFNWVSIENVRRYPLGRAEALGVVIAFDCVSLRRENMFILLPRFREEDWERTGRAETPSCAGGDIDYLLQPHHHIVTHYLLTYRVKEKQNNKKLER